MNVLRKTKQFSFYASFVKRILGFLLMVAFCLVTAALFVQGPIQKNSYMGAEYCGSCHQAEYNSWKASGHALATFHLPKEFQTNQGCLFCHATAVFDTENSVIPSVSCESCHGPGQYYAQLHIKKDPALSKLLFMQKPNIENCRQCHQDSVGVWPAHQAMNKIDHWSITKPFHGTAKASTPSLK